MVQDKATAEDGFREALDDVIAIITKLSPHTSDFTSMVEICQLAKNNDTQLRFLMSLVTAKR